MDTTFIVPKLCYEILNVPLRALAANLGLTVAMLEKIAADNCWVQWFPDDQSEFQLDEDADILEGEDIFTVKADQFLDRNRRKLQVFNMAKSIAIAELYATLEITILDKANQAAKNIDVEDVKSLKDISGVYKDLSKEMQSLSSAIQFAQDEQGLPTVILRDLSGS